MRIRHLGTRYIGMMVAFSAYTTTFINAETFVKSNDPNISYMGRRVMTEGKDVKFNYPGFTALLNFSGESLDMLTSPGSGFWMVEVDGGEAKKMQVTPGDSILSIATSLPEGEHSARVTYCIEGFEFNPEVRGFILPEGGRLLPQDPKGDLKIEFIGNSITCGYGTEAAGADIHFSYDTENHCLGYAYLTARELDADFNMVCRSGIGVYRNFDGPREGSAEGTMPLEYGNALLYDADEPWDFSSFIPDIVCVNLGTNDTSTDNYDITLFGKAYGEFVDRLRGYYPKAKIVLLTGSMLGGKELRDVKTALDDISASREGVYRFDMTPQDGSLGYGADYHPSAQQAQKMASELTAYLRKLNKRPFKNL